MNAPKPVKVEVICPLCGVTVVSQGRVREVSYTLVALNGPGFEVNVEMPFIEHRCDEPTDKAPWDDEDWT